MLLCHLAGEIEVLQERLRHLEERTREREEENKQLRRSLRARELSAVLGGAPAVSPLTVSER